MRSKWILLAIGNIGNNAALYISIYLLTVLANAQLRSKWILLAIGNIGNYAALYNSKYLF